MNPRTRLLAPFAAAFVTAAACGSSGSGHAVPANPQVVVVAPGGLMFDKTSYSAHAGSVGIEYDNNDLQTHTMIIEDANGNKVPGWTRLVVGPHDKQGGTVTLPAGTYKIICDIHLPTMMAALQVSG